MSLVNRLPNYQKRAENRVGKRVGYFISIHVICYLLGTKRRSLAFSISGMNLMTAQYIILMKYSQHDGISHTYNLKITIV